MSRDAMTDLKPCPFCGGKPYDCQHLTYSNWGVGCSCGARGPTVNAGYRPMRDAEIRAHNEAVEAWNQRAALAAEQPQPEAQPVAWMTRESLTRLQRGGNQSRGTVPVHRHSSGVATIPVYTAPPPSAPCPHIRSSGTGEWATHWCALNGPPAAAPSADVLLLLRETFALCEATEDECVNADDAFKRGRAFEAKRIRRGIGTWYQDTLCGRSHMGEPVPVAPPAAPEPSANERRLRRLLCLVKHGRSAYMDDGEAQDSSAHPSIDYLRDSIDEIESKWRQRAALAPPELSGTERRLADRIDAMLGDGKGVT